MHTPAAPADFAVIHLNEDQAIVLFELLATMPDSGQSAEPTAEASVFDDMLAQLEKQLVAPFREDYGDRLATARHRLALASE